MKVIRGGPSAARRWVIAALSAWLWSLPIGIGLIVLALSPLPELARMILLAFGMFGVMAPFFALAALLPGLGFAWALDRRGWLGWLPALLIGLTLGAVMALVLGGNGKAIMMIHGAISGLVLRAMLSRP